MTCHDYSHNLTLVLASFNTTSQEDDYSNVRFAFNHVGLPLVLIIGILGNNLNLLILTRKTLQHAMDPMEKAVHLGLVVLAVSDLSFCVVTLPRSFVPAKFYYTSDDSLLLLVYQTYYEPVTHIFIMSSTWLTVVMAIGRYLAICRPLHTRGYVDLKRTRAALACVFVISVLFNLPMFWRYKMLPSQCAAKCTCYSLTITNLFNPRHRFRDVYFLMGAILGVFLPVVILAFCNVCLIRALQRSKNMRRLYRANQPSTNASDRLTSTLIAIVVLFFTLTLPAHLLKLVRDIYAWNSHNQMYNLHLTATVITNFLLATNFAVNFVLYCVIHVHFRKTLMSFFCCSPARPDFLPSQAPTTKLANVLEPETDV